MCRSAAAAAAGSRRCRPLQGEFIGELRQSGYILWIALGAFH